MLCSCPAFEEATEEAGADLEFPLEASVHEGMYSFIHTDTVLSVGDAALKDADEAPILTEWGFLTRQWKT